jgi:hypothetical protein
MISKYPLGALCGLQAKRILNQQFYNSMMLCTYMNQTPLQFPPLMKAKNLVKVKIIHENRENHRKLGEILEMDRSLPFTKCSIRLELRRANIDVGLLKKHMKASESSKMFA